MKPELYQIAANVRSWAKRRNKYNPTLERWCGICSVRLWRKLKVAGFSPKIAHNDGHAFVIVDGYLVDVTSSQFSGPPIEIIPLKSKTKPYHEIDILEDTDIDFMKSQEDTDWPERQIYKYRIK